MKIANGRRAVIVTTQYRYSVEPHLYATDAVRYPIFHEHGLQTNALFSNKPVLPISYSYRQFRDRPRRVLSREQDGVVTQLIPISAAAVEAASASAAAAISRMSLGTWRNATKLKRPRR